MATHAENIVTCTSYIEFSIGGDIKFLKRI